MTDLIAKLDALHEMVEGVPFATMAITPDEWLQLRAELLAARDAVAVLEHAKELGYLGDGSTAGWADDVLKAYRAARGEG